MKRSTGASRTASSRICVPSTFVVTNSRPPSSIDFSTCDSAAAVTRTRLDTTGRLRVWPSGHCGEAGLRLPGPRSMPRDFQSTPVRVVIVDDHRLFVDALALLLGHDDRLEVIGTASDGRTAIELV